VGTRVLSQGMNEDKNEWSYTSAPLYAFMAWTVTNYSFPSCSISAHFTGALEVPCMIAIHLLKLQNCAAVIL